MFIHSHVVRFVQLYVSLFDRSQVELAWLSSSFGYFSCTRNLQYIHRSAQKNARWLSRSKEKRQLSTRYTLHTYSFCKHVTHKHRHFPVSSGKPEARGKERVENCSLRWKSFAVSAPSLPKQQCESKAVIRFANISKCDPCKRPDYTLHHMSLRLSRLCHFSVTRSMINVTTHQAS